MSVREVQLVLIAGRVVSEIRRGLVADLAIESALSEPNDVMTMWAAEAARRNSCAGRASGSRPRTPGCSGRWWRDAGSN